MDDQKESGPNQQQPNDKPPIAAIGESVQQPEIPNAAPKHKTPIHLRVWAKSQPIGKWVKADWKRSGISKLEAKETWPLFALFFAVAVAAYSLRILSGQLDVMNGQLEEMRGGSSDTHQLAVAAAKQADYAKAQSEQAKAQTDKMGESLKKTDSLITEATKQAEATNRLAEAARKSVDAAKESLHVSERAYVSLGFPLFDPTKTSAQIPLNNIGHIPSGHTEIEIHEMTADETSAASLYSVKECHWKKHFLNAVIPGSSLTGRDNPVISVHLPSASPEKVIAHTEKIVIAGKMSYNDGFPDDTTETVFFCSETMFDIGSKSLGWINCDPKSLIAEIKDCEAYPDGEDRH